ncbi:MAG TPA: DUF3667 domain-containing protein [Longimicrobiaceae bacterium]|nr:DUF3667 domain-containing protein [Longimicrobiaceae bacterium]
MSVAPVCPSCGTALAGPYCHACGERLHPPEELSARHFLHEFGDDVFDLDSRAVRSLRLLLLHPGQLTLEYVEGRRRAYLGPLRLYLTVFAATLFVTLLLPQTQPRQGDSIVAAFRHMVHWVAVQRSLTDAVAERAITQTSAQYVAWISVLIPLVFAAFLFAVFHRRRRWFGEHLVFATHFATFNFLVALLLIPVQLLMLRVTPAAAVVVSAAALVPLCAYTMVAVRRVYGTGWVGAAASTLGLFIAFSIAQSVTGLLALAAAVFKITYFGV